jgi:replicative DNA helicase
VYELIEGSKASQHQSFKRLAESKSTDAELAIVAPNPRGRVGPKRADQLLVEFVDRVAAVTESNDEVAGVRTGFFDLDRLLGGLHPGELYVLGSRPSMGNTTVAVTIAAHVAISEGLPVLYFSAQARNQETLNRLIASTGRIDRRRLTAGQLSDDEWKRLADAVDSVHKAPIYIDDSSPLTIDEVLHRSKDVKDEAGAIGLLIVDSLEMLADHDQPDGGSTAIRKLRLLARELDCPILLLAGVSRLAETRINKRPILSDLIAAEAIERNASVVLLLYRDDYYNRDSPSPGFIELIVAKNRAGATSTVSLAFMKAIGRVENLAYAGTSSK